MNRRQSSLGLLFFFLLLTAMGCSLPQAPGRWSWDSHLTVPFGTHTYGMWNLVDSDADLRQYGWGIGMNTDSSMYFASFQELRASFIDSLYVPPREFGLTKPITALLMPVNLEQTDNYSLARLNPDIAALHGTVQNLPSHPLSSTSPVDFGADVDSFVVDTGSIALTISNTLPYAVSGLDLKLDNGQGTRYALLSDAQIAANGQLSQRVSMQAMSAAQNGQFIISATGAGGNNILVDSTNGLVVESRIDTLQSAPYYGIIPPQALYADSMFNVNQQNRLYLGIIETGSVTFTAINQTQVDDSIWIVVPNLVAPVGDSLVSRQFVPAGQTRTDTVNLHGYRYRLPNETPQRATVRVFTSSAASPDHRTFEAGNEFVRAVVSTSQITFSYYQGKLIALQLPFPSHSTSIERPPQGWDAVRPTTVDGLVNVISGLDVVATTSLDVRTYLGGAQLASRHFDILNLPLSEDTTVTFSGLADLLNQYPDSLTAVGQISLSGPVAIYQTEAVTLDVQLRAPLTFTLSPVHAPGEVQRVEASNLSEIQSGSARVRIWNRLPVGGTTYLVAARDSNAVLPNSGAVVDTIAMSVIPVSQVVNGRATGEVYAELSVTLNDSIIEWLHNPPFYTRLDIALPSSNGDTLMAYGADYVKVQVIADIIYRMNSEGTP